MIERTTTPKGTICKLKNWEQFQNTERVPELQRNADGTPMEPNKKGKKVNNEKKAYDVATESLFQFIDETCQQYRLVNAVNMNALDLQVQRYRNLQLKVETRSAITWILDKGKTSVSTAYLGNWFKKATEIQKRDTNRLLEKPREQFKIDPAVKAKLQILPNSTDA